MPTLYPLIPLNPRIHPVKVVLVLPVYDIISSSIFKRPYSWGNPFVEATVIVVSSERMSVDNVVVPVTTSGTRLSTLRYLSRLSIRSVGPPWNSCDM